MQYAVCGMEIEPEEQPAPLARAAPSAAERIVAALEVLICSDYPTQLLLGATLAALGYRPQLANGDLSFGFFVALSLSDAALLVALILIFIKAGGERPRDIFLGPRSVWREARLGVPMTFGVLALAIGLLLIIRAVVPELHTVERNPLQNLASTRNEAALFAVVVVIAGGVREELQRAFLMHRFDQRLGGPTLGVVITSMAFGLGHLQQGADAAIAIGTIGAFWAMVYLRRRSAVAPMVSHAGFNLVQLAQLLSLR